jgi:phage-related protein
VLYREADGSVPLQQWLRDLPTKARVKCVGRIARLAAKGYELRRPEADLLRDGIYELRIDLQGIHYRILYFFHDNLAVVVSHGLKKERAVPPVEIDRAIVRRSSFYSKPELHTAELEHG